MPAQLSFPSTLSNERHRSIIAFSTIEPKDKLAPLSTSFGVKPVLGSNDVGTVFLYMPDLGDRSYDQKFSGSDMGIIEKVMAAFMGDGAFWDEFGKATTAVASGLGGDARDLLSTDIANPHTTTRYEGPTLRTQSFEFHLFPRNESELKAIRDIVQFFKYNSSTIVGAGVTKGKDVAAGAGFADRVKGNISNGVNAVSNALVGDRLKYPNQWLIQEILPESGKNRIMPRFIFGPAYCESVTITDSKDRYTFKTGDSISYTLKLKFTEATMLTSADINAGA